MKSLVPSLLAAVAVLAIPTSASAHRQWLLPSETNVSGTDSWVTVDAAVSNDLFDPDHVAMQTGGITVTQPDGSAGKIQNAATGRYRSVFDVQLDKPGTWKIGTFSTNASGTFTLNGEEWTVGRRRGPPPAAANAPVPRAVMTAAEIPAGATDIKLTEAINRNEIFVTSDAPTATVLTPTGKGLEFDPQTHPSDLVANEPAKFRFLIDGKPAAGLKVTLVPGGKRFRDAEGAQELTTGADGTIDVTWPLAGFYWLNASATDNNAATANATQRRMSYTSTLEVSAP